MAGRSSCLMCVCVCVAIAFRKDASRCCLTMQWSYFDQSSRYIKPVQSISSRSAGGQELVVNNNKLLNPWRSKNSFTLRKGVWPAPSLDTIISQLNIKGMPGRPQKIQFKWNIFIAIWWRFCCVHFPLCVLHVGGMDAMINQAHDVFSHTSIGLHPTERKYTDGLRVPQPDTWPRNTTGKNRNCVALVIPWICKVIVKTAVTKEKSNSYFNKMHTKQIKPVESCAQEGWL